MLIPRSRAHDVLPDFSRASLGGPPSRAGESGLTQLGVAIVVCYTLDAPGAWIADC